MKTPKSRVEALKMMIGRVDQFISGETKEYFSCTNNCPLCMHARFRHGKNRYNLYLYCCEYCLLPGFGSLRCVDFIPTGKRTTLGHIQRCISADEKHALAIPRNKRTIAWFIAARADMQKLLGAELEKRGKK